MPDDQPIRTRDGLRIAPYTSNATGEKVWAFHHPRHSADQYEGQRLIAANLAVFVTRTRDDFLPLAHLSLADFNARYTPVGERVDAP